MKYLQGYFHLQKMPELIVPVLNEIFGTNYPLDVPLEQLQNEHQTLNGEKITDSYFRIGKKGIAPKEIFKYISRSKIDDSKGG